MKKASKNRKNPTSPTSGFRRSAKGLSRRGLARCRIGLSGISRPGCSPGNPLRACSVLPYPLPMRSLLRKAIPFNQTAPWASRGYSIAPPVPWLGWAALLASMTNLALRLRPDEDRPVSRVGGGGISARQGDDCSNRTRPRRPRRPINAWRSLGRAVHTPATTAGSTRMAIRP
jgi:hypothetical protein